MACQDTLNEEYGHVGLGMDGVKDLAQDSGGPRRGGEVGAEMAAGRASPRSAATSRAPTSAIRHWGFKSATNEDMRETYYQQVRAFIVKDWGVPLPATGAEFIASIGGDLSKHVMYVG